MCFWSNFQLKAQTQTQTRVETRARVRRCWAPPAWPTRPSRPRWVPERPGVPRATAVVDLVDRLEALAVGRPSNAAASTEMVRTSSGSPSVGPRSRAWSRTVETSSLRGRRARSSRLTAHSGCGRRGARTSSVPVARLSRLPGPDCRVARAPRDPLGRRARGCGTRGRLGRRLAQVALLVAQLTHHDIRSVLGIRDTARAHEGACVDVPTQNAPTAPL